MLTRPGASSSQVEANALASNWRTTTGTAMLRIVPDDDTISTVRVTRARIQPSTRAVAAGTDPGTGSCGVRISVVATARGPFVPDAGAGRVNSSAR